MKIGIVGYQGSGKSTLFHWLTGVPADPAQAHTAQSAMAQVPEPRVAGLCAIYKPKKVTLAALELVDTPGLSRDHAGSAAKLALIRESGCLLVVVEAFGGANPAADLRNFEDDLLIADLDLVSNRLERLRESVKKPRPNRDEQLAELAALEPLHAALEAGRALRELDLSPDQARAIRSFQLFTQKPRLLLLNTSDDAQHVPPELRERLAPGSEAVAASLSLQLELSQMPPAERAEFCREMQVAEVDRDELLRTIMRVSGQMLFFTAGEKEVRTWMIRQGCTAVEAAGGIHTDLAKGFIRAATMNCDDLIRLGSEREIKAANLLRQEPRDYVIQDGDVIEIRHN
jgi:ribosome-binding ATPase YchF (GTP1/OBG family)